MGCYDIIATSGKFQEGDTKLKWDDLQRTAFERIITSIHDFCLFMRDLYVPDDDILIPPASGWDSITTESFVNLRKSPIVIETLKHMTFMKAYMTGDAYEIIPYHGGLCDWRSPRLLRTLAQIPRDGKLEGAEGVRIMTETIDPAPADVIGLIMGGRNASILLLDCKYGIIDWNDCAEGRTLFGQWAKEPRYQHHEGDDATWRSETAWPVEEFFEYIKGKFVSMKQLPCSKYELDGDASKEKINRLREIYTRHGWPDNFDKAGCAQEVNKLP